MKRRHLSGIILFLLSLQLVGYAQDNDPVLTANYNKAIQFMQSELGRKHPIIGWPELRSDWFIRITYENSFSFYEISGFSIWNENLILNIQKANTVKKSDGIKMMYVLGKDQYLNINLNDSILLAGDIPGVNSNKKQKKASTWIKYKKFEIDHRGDDILQSVYKKNENYDQDMVVLLYNHLTALKSFVNNHNINTDSVLVNFQKEFKKLSSLSPMSEEQRKFIVQANAANEEKDYNKASELFDKAVKLNPYSYSPAYYNMALIASQLGRYQYAIFNMKKYLILSPEAQDARAAQDKIYEWEMKFDL
jgi:tetratricopeptide (TPR) repeat protein